MYTHKIIRVGFSMKNSSRMLNIDMMLNSCESTIFHEKFSHIKDISKDIFSPLAFTNSLEVENNNRLTNTMFPNIRICFCKILQNDKKHIS